MIKIYRNIIILSAVFLFATIVSCDKDEKEDIPPTVYNPTTYNMEVPQGFPTNLNIPDDNPITEEGVKLGRYLFYDGRLSGRDEEDSLMSCATCHLQSAAFEIGENHPKYPDGHPHGLNGKETPHFPLPLFNLIWNNEGYLWNGFISKENTNLGIPSYGIPAEPQYHLTNIESLVWMGIVAEHEINGTIEMTEQMIRSIDMYPALFEAAFGDKQINIDRISKSIAQFIRTIVSSNSKFDKYLRGETNLSPAESRGLVLFQTEEGADCFHCHGSAGNPLMTTHLFYNNAKDNVFNDPRDRYGVTGNEIDRGAYKATTLRNIEHTGPYMHDGRFKTLDEVIDFYSEGLVYSEYAHPLMEKLRPPYGKGAELNPPQKADLKAFLLSLTDETLLTEEKYSNPF
ncbi:MAG: hypothetical protein KAG84_07285 [Bacteroidales bacterium]|nr:hypothetical protein [Bacteroidales bacterium]